MRRCVVGASYLVGPGGDALDEHKRARIVRETVPELLVPHLHLKHRLAVTEQLVLFGVDDLVPRLASAAAGLGVKRLGPHDVFHLNALFMRFVRH
jgi:hypothetical protein